MCMSFTPYLKVPLSFESQAQLLVERGIQGDFDFIVKRLRSVNYYRLSAYWISCLQCGEDGEKLDVFIPGTRFEDIWACYAFDRRLRLHVTDALERIEIDFKTNFINVLTMKTGDSFAHLNEKNFPGFPLPKPLPGGQRKNYDFKNTVRLFDSFTKRSREQFVREHREKYSGDLPFWKSCEVIPFGVASTLFEGLDNHTKRIIGSRYGMSALVFENAIKHLCYVRNLCAHHSRLWNRVLAIRFSVPVKKNLPIFHAPRKIPNNKVFGTLSLIRYFMAIIAPQSRWAKNFEELFSDIPIALMHEMGFPEDWKNFDLWKDKIPEQALQKSGGGGGGGAGAEFGGGAGKDELAAGVSAAGSELDEPVGAADDVAVVLDNDERVAGVAQLKEQV